LAIAGSRTPATVNRVLTHRSEKDGYSITFVGAREQPFRTHKQCYGFIFGLALS
jgi:hypothetical protein